MHSLANMVVGKVAALALACLLAICLAETTFRTTKFTNRPKVNMGGKLLKCKYNIYHTETQVKITKKTVVCKPLKGKARGKVVTSFEVGGFWFQFKFTFNKKVKKVLSARVRVNLPGGSGSGQGTGIGTGSGSGR